MYFVSTLAPFDSHSLSILHNTGDASLRIDAMVQQRRLEGSELANAQQASESTPLNDLWNDANSLRIAHATRLWNPTIVASDTATTQSEAPKAPPLPAPAPTHFELLAITTSPDGSREVTLYDRNKDHICILAIGDTLDRYVITSITNTSVTLTQGSRDHRLHLPAALG